jgi:hypothetical protein
VNDFELAKGKLESGPQFRLLVDRSVYPDDLRAIACLLHGLATKLENEPDSVSKTE